MTPLCKLAKKYKTDKCPYIGRSHSYTPVYYEMFKDKPIKKVLEVGIGEGGSLRMWRDFFPNAQIYGADINKKWLFEEERIKTFLCDETKEEDLKALIKKTGKNLDIVIDDASHRLSHQLFMARTLLPMLKKDVIYVIEDVRIVGKIRRELKDYYCTIHQFPGEKGKLIIIRKP